jgi:hypothetical protein
MKKQLYEFANKYKYCHSRNRNFLYNRNQMLMALVAAVFSSQTHLSQLPHFFSLSTSTQASSTPKVPCQPTSVLKRPHPQRIETRPAKRVSFSLPSKEAEKVVVATSGFNAINAPPRPIADPPPCRKTELDTIPLLLADKYVAPVQIRHVLVTSKLNDTERRKYSVTAGEFIPSRILWRDVSAIGNVRYKVRFCDGHVAMVFFRDSDSYRLVIND